MDVTRCNEVEILLSAFRKTYGTSRVGSKRDLSTSAG